MFEHGLTYFRQSVVRRGFLAFITFVVCVCVCERKRKRADAAPNITVWLSLQTLIDGPRSKYSMVGGPSGPVMRGPSA